MSLLTLNNYPVIAAEIRMPRVGVFSGDLVVDTDKDISGTVTVKTEDGKFSLTGMAYREGGFVNHTRVRLVGGAGGMNKILSPKAFDGYTVKSILSDILSKCGETLSKTTDQTLLGQFIQKWVVLGHSGKSALKALLESSKATGWRILPDGTFYACLNEKWVASPLKQFDIITWNRSEGWAFIGSDEPFIYPGTTIQMDDGAGKTSTQKVSYVTHRIENSKIRSQLYFEDV